MNDDDRKDWENVLEWTKARDGSFESLEDALNSIAEIAKKKLEHKDDG